MMMKRGIILIDHGSRRKEANAALETMARYLEEELSEHEVEDHLVRVAHMELLAPTLEDAARALAAEGAREIIVFPYFLADGRHVSEDIPQQIEALKEVFPELQLTLLGPLGPDRALAKLIAARLFGDAT